MCVIEGTSIPKDPQSLFITIYLRASLHRKRAVCRYQAYIVVGIIEKYNQDGQAQYMSETALSITFQDACHVMSWMLHEAVPFGTSGSKKVALLQIYANIAMRTYAHWGFVRLA